MFSKGVIKRIRRSVAIRLSVTFALLFTVGFTALFVLLYWLLGKQLAQRDEDAVRNRIEEYAHIYNTQGEPGLQLALYRGSNTLLDRPLFVRMIMPNGATPILIVPNDWIDKEAKRVRVPDSWGFWTEQQVYSWRVPQDQQEDLIVFSKMLRGGFLLQVGVSTNNRATLLKPLQRTFTFVAGAVVLVGFAVGWFAARRAVKPLQGVIDTAQQIISTGALDARVAEPRRDNDIAELVRLFNTVLDKNAALLRSMREALDNVAHDLRTPLTSMRGTAELALANGGEPAMRDALADNIERSDEVLRLLRALMEISEADSGMLKLKREQCNVETILRAACDLYADVADARAQTLEVAPFAASLFVSADPIRLRQVIVNLVDNALKYTPDGGRVVLGARAETRGAQNGALLTVSDNGPGVPEAEQGRIWERLYRSDQSRSQTGLGLGLSLVRAIIEAHGGVVSVRNAVPPEHGAIFEVWLPE
ncbi:hypothetical protein CKA38_02090 [Ereboglobus luteus]|uniref:histidine kinase n=1 Tax=Ereboglobus luteus TaxID=1796921 RepID=A0A2U8E054_9BACT|nr:hypothetical protein CKA38_02090 [Ereboglobus luteus]